MNPLAAITWLAMLAPPATRLSDVERFPPADHLRACVKANLEYQCWLNHQIVWRSSGGRDCSGLQDAYAETKQLHAIYDALGGAAGYDGPSMESNPDGAMSYRLHWLWRFRELVGEAAYWSGELPPPVPLWRFEVVR